jgi:hypothetical protein
MRAWYGASPAVRGLLTLWVGAWSASMLLLLMVWFAL